MDKSAPNTSLSNKRKNAKPHLIVIAAAWPFPGKAGQQQRVRNKLIAWRPHFHLSFLTFAPPGRVSEVSEYLHKWVDDPLVLPSLYSQSQFSRLTHRTRGALFSLRTGLKFSNYIIGKVELTPGRLATVLDEKDIDLAVFEYWHSVKAIVYFKRRQIPTILDMHDLLWQSYSRQLSRWYIPVQYKRWAVGRYRQREEAAWEEYDGLIAINRAEYNHVMKHLPQKLLFYAPMGIDLKRWPYSWQATNPPKIAYYGSLGSARNQEGAWRCYETIMPQVWEQHPKAELWIIGNNPPARIQALPKCDPRVFVTGFVPDVQNVLAKMTVVACPWEGRFGFRSRFIEVMALGIAVVTTPDAVYGMGLEPSQGLYLGDDDMALATQLLKLLADPVLLARSSTQARRQVEEQFSFEQTYGCLSSDMVDWLSSAK
jgi:glycosyltransferase involved in cell wall biosynthesis